MDELSAHRLKCYLCEMDPGTKTRNRTCFVFHRWDFSRRVCGRRNISWKCRCSGRGAVACVTLEHGGAQLHIKKSARIFTFAFCTPVHTQMIHTYFPSEVMEKTGSSLLVLLVAIQNCFLLGKRSRFPSSFPFKYVELFAIKDADVAILAITCRETIVVRVKSNITILKGIVCVCAGSF